MSTFNAKTHPICMVPRWIDCLGEDWVATLSRYQYIPQRIEDQRELITIRLGDLTHSWLAMQLSSLQDGYELAFHSVLRSADNSHEVHIPMVDFSATSIGFNETLSWAYQYLEVSLQLFDSGRSYHGYGTAPISLEKWVQLMGLLLLSNHPNQLTLIDARWVGHRLLAGYSALRWSKNTPHYVKIPTLLSDVIAD